MSGAARFHLPRGRDGLRLLLLAALVPMAVSCNFKGDGLGEVTGVANADGGPSRDAGGAVMVNRSDGGAADAAIRSDASTRDGYSPPPPPDVRDAAIPPDTAAPEASPPPPPPPPDALPPDTTPPPVPDAAPGAQLLFLIGDTMIAPGDEALRAHLASLGYQVQVKTVATDPQVAEARALAAGVALVVMSNSLPQGTGLPAQLRDLPVPILCSKAAFWDNLGIGEARAFSTANAETNILIRADHPLAAGRKGEITVTTQPRPFGLGIPVPAAVRVATIFGEVDEVLIFGLEKGAAGRFGPAPARRVGWFAHEPTYLSLNENGWALLDAAVRWLAGP